MQINGVSDFVSKITSFNGSASEQGNASLPIQSPRQAVGDSLLLSDISKPLSLNVNKAPALSDNPDGAENQKAARAKKWEEVIASTNNIDPIIDKSMKKAEYILEKMHDLTVVAQNTMLSDFERVNLQIEIEDLRGNLMMLPRSLLSQSRGGPEYDSYINAFQSLKATDSSLLGRALDRVIKGQNWNVREAFSPIRDDDGVIIEDTVGEWHVVGDENITIKHTILGHDGYNGHETFYKTEASTEKVQTTREILEREAYIVVMDAESAAEGAEYLERQIVSLQKSRAQFTERTDEYDAYKILERATDIGLENLLLTENSIPYYFLDSDGVSVYQRKYAMALYSVEGQGDLSQKEMDEYALSAASNLGLI